jgi:hypothetical protein
MKEQFFRVDFPEESDPAWFGDNLTGELLRSELFGETTGLARVGVDLIPTLANIWNGSAWIPTPAKIWNGSAWISY